ncbi:MAG: glycosyltransferase family 4 protein [Candidatus Ratteibacteria bacterium]
MRIGIEITPLIWGKKAGIGWYAWNLVKHIKKIDKENTYFLFGSTLRGYRKSGKFLIDEFGGDNFKVVLKFFPGRFHNYFFQTFVPIETFYGKFDIIQTLHPFSPVKFKAKYIATIHDLTPLISNEWFPKLNSEKFRFIITKTIKRADKIIVDSVSTKNDIIKLFNYPEKDIEVIYLASDEIYKPIEEKEEIEKIKKKYSINKRYILFVGTIEPRKNLVRLLNVFEKLKRKYKDYQLVICGQIGWMTEKFFEKMKDLPESVKNDIILTGYLPINHLPFLYNGCECLIYPSLYEGFGLPVLEAMSCGVPVITSNISSLPEVGGDACIYVNPYDEDEIFNKLEMVLNNGEIREKLKQKGLERAKLFSWEKTAKKTIEVYKSLK